MCLLFLYYVLFTEAYAMCTLFFFNTFKYGIINKFDCENIDLSNVIYFYNF